MADRFHVVAVPIPHEGAVVVRVVLRPDTGFVEHVGPSRPGGIAERPDRAAVGGGEGDVRFAEAVAGPLRAEPEVGPGRYAVADDVTELHDPGPAEGRQHGV